MSYGSLLEKKTTYKIGFRSFHQGGMRAVIWTDTFQILVSLIGVLVLLIKSVIVVGGLGVAWESALRTGRIKFSE